MGLNFRKNIKTENCYNTTFSNNNYYNNTRRIKLISYILVLIITVLLVIFVSSCCKYAANNQDQSKTTETIENLPSYTTMYSTVVLNVRNGPGTNYDILSTLQPGDQVQVIETDGEWSVINYLQSTAYVSSQYLTPEPVVIETTTTVQTTSETVWVSYYGSKYHRKSSCSGMKGPQSMSREEAERLGRTPCKKCY